MSPGNRRGDLVDELIEELADGILEDEESLQAEIETLGGVVAMTTAIEEAQREAKRALGEARRAIVKKRSRTRIVQDRGQYDALTDEEVASLWIARTEGLSVSESAIQFRGFEDVTPQDLRTLLEDLDRLQARGERDEDE